MAARISEVIFLTLSSLYSAIQGLLQIHLQVRSKIKIIADCRFFKITSGIVIDDGKSPSILNYIVAERQRRAVQYSDIHRLLNQIIKCRLQIKLILQKVCGL